MATLADLGRADPFSYLTLSPCNSKGISSASHFFEELKWPRINKQCKTPLSIIRCSFRWTPPNFFSCGPHHKKFQSHHLHPETSSTTAHSSPFSPSPSLVGSHAPQLPRPFLSFHRWRGLQEDTAAAAAHGGLSGGAPSFPFLSPSPMAARWPR